VQKAVYSKFRSIVRDTTGIDLGPSKETLVAARVGKRMRALGLTSHRDYLDVIATDTTGDETRELADAICTNVTGFFREEDHFAFVREAVLERAATGERRLRLWSAACSTGEEVYSLAMTLRDVVDDVPGIDLKILGTDLSGKALRAALGGRYAPSRLEAVHPSLRDLYFHRSGAGEEEMFTVDERLVELTVFRRLNLARPPYALAGPIDIVMCRNVMIYFDKPVRLALLAEIRRLLRPGGYLLVGHAESLSGIRSDFVPIRPSVYMRP
jgi:chemotaxis protein methyltransferase CheR